MSVGSSSSLSRYAIARSPNVDPYNGNPSRDFCNAFWGAGDAGVNILFARMRGAARTTDDLRNFWKQRSIIEEQYSNSLFELAKMSIGKDEIGELRNALDTLKLETSKIATAHAHLSTQIHHELESPTTTLLTKQVEHRRSVQTPLEKKFKTKQTQEAYVVKARDKYTGDCIRITGYNQQMEANPGRDAERIQRRLEQAQQTVKANEKDYAAFIKDVQEMSPAWESEWKEYCDECQDLEEERVEFMKDIMWTYANAVSTVCVTDDLSCEAIRTVLDQLEPDRDVENFVLEYGTGNSVPDPPDFVPYEANADQPAPTFHTARFSRQTKRHHHHHHAHTGSNHDLNGDITAIPSPPPPEQPAPVPPNSIPPAAAAAVSNTRTTRTTTPEPRTNGTGNTNHNRSSSRAPVSRQPSRKGQPRRESVPLPMQPTSTPQPPPVPVIQSAPDDAFNNGGGGEGSGGGILFYVKALYDYTATIDEEFDFQAGDIIAVTATPDDGWWSGELLDEERREEGRHIFPSNFVCLF